MRALITRVLGLFLANCMAAACTTQGAVSEARQAIQGRLIPTGVITGGMSGLTLGAPTPIPTGPLRPAPFPPPMQPPPQPTYIKLIFPTALAATGNDLFVADSGQGALLRIDLTNQGVQRLATLPSLPEVRLRAAADGSVYVLRPDRQDISHLRRDGTSLGTLSGQPLAGVIMTDLVIEPVQRRLWLGDRLNGMFELQLVGGFLQPLPLGGDGGTPARPRLLASGRQAVFGILEDCQCLARLDRNGRPVAHGEPGKLISATALAVDQWDQAWVIDGADGQLRIFVDLAEVASLPPQALGLGTLSALAIDNTRLFLADGPGGRIAGFAIVPPRTSPQ